MPESDPTSARRSDASLSQAHTEAVDRFVAFWGEMASTWGINRTMAQIHALLYCTEAPLNTDDIMARLDISRGNANMNLRSLVEWDLVAKTHLPDSRKDYYVAEKNVWKITTRIIQERERREIRPVKEQLRTCASLLTDESTAEGTPPTANLSEADRVLHERFQNLIRLMNVFEGFSEALLPLVQEQNVETIQHLIRMVRSLNDADAPARADS